MNVQVTMKSLNQVKEALKKESKQYGLAGVLNENETGAGRVVQLSSQELIINSILFLIGKFNFLLLN